jgi:hypothetical protein
MPGQVDVRDHRPVGLSAQEASSGHQEATARQPADGPAEAGRSVADDLAGAVETDHDDLCLTDEVTTPERT